MSSEVKANKLSPATGTDVTLGDSSDTFTVPSGATLTVAGSFNSVGDVSIDTGNLVIGTAGKGIDFSAQTSTAATGAAATSEILDHYEEGTWTAVVTDGTNPMTMNASWTTGYYTKVGNLVTVSGCFYTTSLGSASGNIRITGLPFTVPNNGSAYSSGGIRGNSLAITAGHSVTYYGEINTDYIILEVWDVTTGVSAMQASEWTANGGIVMGFSYRAA